MKKPFSFPVRFIEELNALNFSYKSIHLMAHHTNWSLNWYAHETAARSKDFHIEHIGIDNALKLDSEKASCTKFHYLCRFVDIDDNVSYSFVEIHRLCQEWNFAAEKNSKFPYYTYDPFGFGYLSAVFKHFVFSNITFCSAYMLKTPTKAGIFQLIAINKNKKNEDGYFGNIEMSIIDGNGASMLYKEASQVSAYAVEFIAAFFGFKTHTYIGTSNMGSCQFTQTLTCITQNRDVFALLYRDC